MDIETARKRLGELLADLDHSVATLQGESPERGTEELAHYDQHPADSASNLSDADRVEAVLQAAQQQRAEVLAAIQRIESGTYGRCVDCDTPLPDGRLEARPEAARCVRCQTKREARR